jgi:hypothetical protein
MDSLVKYLKPKDDPFPALTRLRIRSIKRVRLQILFPQFLKSEINHAIDLGMHANMTEFLMAATLHYLKSHNITPNNPHEL